MIFIVSQKDLTQVILQKKFHRLGELNAKYPGGVEAQKEMLEKEGHIVIQKGRTNIKYYVNDYEKALFTL